MRRTSGQATLETVVVMPLLITVALALGHVLAAGLSRELAGHAAEAGAIALIHGADVEDAARAALPEWARERVQVKVEERRVRARLLPPAVVPEVADALAATQTADAGADPAATARVIGRALEP